MISLVDLRAAQDLASIRQHTSAYVSSCTSIVKQLHIFDILVNLVAAVYVSVCIRQRMLHTSAYVFDILGDLVAAGKALLRPYLY